jgi:hypothetical protein
MKNSWFKIFLIFVIIMFINFCNVSSNSFKEECSPIYNLKEDNENVKPMENYEEIITFIYGACDEVIINKDGIIKDVEFYCWGTCGVELGIRGWVKPFKHIHEIGMFDIYSSKFIGRIIPTDAASFIIRGYSIGDMEWG